MKRDCFETEEFMYAAGRFLVAFCILVIFGYFLAEINKIENIMKIINQNRETVLNTVILEQELINTKKEVEELRAQAEVRKVKENIKTMFEVETEAEIKFKTYTYRKEYNSIEEYRRLVEASYSYKEISIFIKAITFIFLSFLAIGSSIVLIGLDCDFI